MYQIRWSSGYTIVYRTHCETARVDDASGRVVFRGTAAACERWLTERRCYRV